MSALRAAPVHSSMGVDLRARAEAGAQSTAAAGRRRARERAESLHVGMCVLDVSRRVTAVRVQKAGGEIWLIY